MLKRVFLSGGLGNQLFQHAFAHCLQQEFGEKPTLINLNIRGGLPHTKEILDASKLQCNSCEQVSDWGVSLINRFLDPWQKRNSAQIFWGETLDFQNKPFEYLDNLSSLHGYRNFVGYFQNKEYVWRCEETLRQEIRTMLKEFPNGQVLEGTEVEVVHVRQGDTTSVKNRKRVGVLSSEYYKKILESRSRMTRIVVTDDLEGARKTLSKFQIDLWMGPDDLGTLQALELMSRAKRLVTANSTLSWWAGFLAVSKKSDVIIPKPFFVSKDLDTREAFEYTGFETLASIFE